MRRMSSAKWSQIRPHELVRFRAHGQFTKLLALAVNRSSRYLWATAAVGALVAMSLCVLAFILIRDPSPGFAFERPSGVAPEGSFDAATRITLRNETLYHLSVTAGVALLIVCGTWLLSGRGRSTPSSRGIGAALVLVGATIQSLHVFDIKELFSADVTLNFGDRGRSERELIFWVPGGPAAPDSTMQFRALGETRPFKKGSHSEWEAEEALVRDLPTAKELVDQRVRCDALGNLYLVTGGADREPINVSKALYGENVQLAYSRALGVASELERKMQTCGIGATPPIIAIPRGPGTIMPEASATEQANDRTARLYVAGR